MRKKITLLVLSIILVLSILIGSTYSALFKVDEGVEQSYTTGNLEIISNATNDSVTLTNALPMEDSVGATSKPYTFKITNTGNLNYRFNVKFLSTTTDLENMINPENIKIMVNDNEPVTLYSLSLINGVILENIELSPMQSIEITIRVWLDINTQNTEIGKVFNAKIVTEGQAIHSDQTVHNSAYNVLASLNLTDSIKTDNPTFNKSSCSSGCGESTVGIYSMEDDIGISYYFRGDVTNNYVKFGKYNSDAYQRYNSATGVSTYDSTCSTGTNITCRKIASAGNDMYWRIIRINGDGTVRMIYAGTSARVNGVDWDATVESIGLSPFNINDDDSAYVGYMYGTVPSTSYNNAHTNTNDSSVKIALDAWYQKYLYNNYSSSIADAIYCNDRSLDTSVSGNMGFGIEYSRYGATKRMYSSPSLKCINANDRFTKNNSTIKTLDGLGTNKALTYPIGLITADETLVAGSGGSGNEYSYLALSDFYLSASPYGDFAEKASNYVVRFNSMVDLDGYASTSYHVLPVISLKADALKYSATSNGSMQYPFTITG